MEKALITRLDPRSPVAEAFRQLRTSIQFASPDRPIRSLLLTSTGPEEGKTTTLANLAVAFAQAGSRVIMVDADLRRPGLHKLFGLKNQVGLTTLVVGDPEQEVPLFETGVENLWLLPSGPLPPNPAELLASRRMAEVMERLAKAADYVLYDSPPVLAVTDAAILASRVDGVLLVLQAGRTRREFARRAKAALEKVNARILGTVLTGVKPERTLQAYYGEGE
jgi:non-specific protein-tyrosine kinase